MKRFNFLFLLAIMFVMANGNAFALQCKDGNTLGTDECYTDVYLTNTGTAGSVETVSRGTIVVVSSGLAILNSSAAGTSVASNDGFTVRRTTSSLDFGTMGVIQTTVASADLPKWTRALVRGRGAVRVQNAAGNPEIVSGDVLRLKTSTGFQGQAEESIVLEAQNGSTRKIGQALNNSTEAGTDHLIYADIDLM